MELVLGKSSTIADTVNGTSSPSLKIVTVSPIGFASPNIRFAVSSVIAIEDSDVIGFSLSPLMIGKLNISKKSGST